MVPRTMALPAELGPGVGVIDSTAAHTKIHTKKTWVVVSPPQPSRAVFKVRTEDYSYNVMLSVTNRCNFICKSNNKKKLVRKVKENRKGAKTECRSFWNWPFRQREQEMKQSLVQWGDGQLSCVLVREDFMKAKTVEGTMKYNETLNTRIGYWIFKIMHNFRKIWERFEIWFGSTKFQRQ